MVSTVTTSTVSTVTTVAALGLMGTLGIVVSIVLVSFLATKELASSSEGPRHRLIARSLDIGIIPLIMAFAVIVVMKIAEILG